MLPVYITIREKVEEQLDYNDFFQLETRILKAKSDWYSNEVRSSLLDVIQKFKHTAPISNIVCIGLGTLHQSSLEGGRSLAQHIVAYTLAEELTRMYKEEGIALQEPITIVAQDPAYTGRDLTFLSDLPVPIRIEANPGGFLSINAQSLVFSSFPVVPVKQIIADLARESPDGKGPAALFMNNNHRDKLWGDFDIIRIPRDSPSYYANPETRGYVETLQSYEQIMDGKRLFGAADPADGPDYDWLSGMDIWAREE
ncbi:uncharacterized protein J4E84_002004 [Alternaria hordeiaustralica]|uniref:uncharacterized protein n=1 Tax=Alternaria hordeiaustralica TaxID=1187925 RepID=UPI0020C44463|nr:uncharacterized protein J4E84_002004 [Alternaria hordeiaustralica]KAI4695378.1 hypothetical protein J4E84_002004 [Alternaria hordeiaustralica]